MKMPWHTPGYIKLAHATMYIGMQLNAGLIASREADDTIRILIEAGKQIRRENER